MEQVLVKIGSDPMGAQIYIDNKEKGETDNGLFLYPSEYTLKLIKNGYVTVEQMITVSETGDNLFSTLLEKNSGTLTLSLTPSDARVLINKKDYTGKRIVELTQGRHTIDVQKDGYIGQSDTIDLPRGGGLAKQYTLIAKTGTLQLI